MSYLPERTYLNPSMKVKEAVDYFADFYEDFSRQKALDMLEKFGINEQDKIKSLSKGTREKVQIVLVMSREAKLYLLDEPMGGVDPAARDYILRTIISNYNEDATVVITTHLISDIENVLDDPGTRHGCGRTGSGYGNLAGNFGSALSDLHDPALSDPSYERRRVEAGRTHARHTLQHGDSYGTSVFHHGHRQRCAPDCGKLLRFHGGCGGIHRKQGQHVLLLSV